MNRKSVNIACWNIICLKSRVLDKSNDPIFLKDISSFDTVCLSEIKCNIDYRNFVSYKTHVIQRKLVTSDVGLVFGGTAILIKRNIRAGVKFMPQIPSEYQRFKLDKDYFGLYVCFIYHSPRNSTVINNCNEDMLETISSGLIKYSSDGDILLCGDFNARTGCHNSEFIINDDGLYVPVPSDYLPDSNIKHRLSQDRVIDSRGRERLDLCIERQMRILNGNFGDSHGMYTSYKYNGNSAVDYMIASENLFTQILYFNVGLNIPRLSDHSKLSGRIMANYCSEPGTEKLFKPQPKYKWSSISASAFQGALFTKNIKLKIKDLENSDHDSSIDLLFRKLHDIIISAADLS